MGHIATNCPSTTGHSTSGTPASGTGTNSGQHPRTAPPARGHATTTQEGESHSSSSNTTGTHRVRGSGSSSRNAMVCMARAIHLEQAMSARRVLVMDYNLNPTQRRPGPQPRPTLMIDHDGTHLLDTDRFVMLIFPLSPGQFNIILEDHIARQIAPAHYGGNLNLLDDGLWLTLHDHPLSEVDRSFAAITYPNGITDVVIESGIIPMLENGFHIPTETLHNCTARFCFLIQAYLTHWLHHCWQLGHQDAPVRVMSRNNTLCITFYPIVHDVPVLVQDGNHLYIVPEHTIPSGMVVQRSISALSNNDEENYDSSPRESARMAITIPSTASAFAIREKDPS